MRLGSCLFAFTTFSHTLGPLKLSDAENLCREDISELQENINIVSV